MGLGTLLLYADSDADPRELLNEFALDEFFPLEVLSRYRDPAGDMRVYVVKTDCSFTFCCSLCGIPMCPGCGDEPSLAITRENVLTGWCHSYCIQGDD